MVNAAAHAVGNSLVYAGGNKTEQDPSILWKKAQQCSNAYGDRLGLTPAELKIVRSNAAPSLTGELPGPSLPEDRGFLFVTIKDKKFRLVLDSVSGHAYREGWKDLIQVFCASDSSLNMSTGGGSVLVNVVPDEWHELLLGELQGDLILDFKKRVSAAISRHIRLWKQVRQNSEEICARLGLEINELPAVKCCLLPNTRGKSKSLLHCEETGFNFSLRDKSFKLDIERAFGPCDGDGSINLIQVICTNDASINESMGRVTTFVNVISEQWHRLFLDPSQDAIMADLKQRISENRSHHTRLWKQLQIHSDEICQRLNCSGADLQEMNDCLSKILGSRSPEVKLTKSFTLTIGNKIFVLSARNVCGLNYGGQWTHLITAVCFNDESLNESMGGGTALVSVINELWHQKLLKKIEACVIDHESKVQGLPSAAECSQGGQREFASFEKAE